MIRALILAALLLFPALAIAQQPTQQSPEITALAVAQWVTSVAQENARLRETVAALQQENAKLKEPKPTPETPK